MQRPSTCTINDHEVEFYKIETQDQMFCLISRLNYYSFYSRLNYYLLFIFHKIELSFIFHKIELLFIFHKIELLFIFHKIERFKRPLGTLGGWVWIG
jgi:hypothetical protein